MFFAQINFPFSPYGWDEEAQKAASSILSALLHNGQICSRDYSLLTTPNGFSAFVLIPDKDALEAEHNNQWVERDIQQFIAAGGQRPVFTVIGADVQSTGPCECTQFMDFILYTRYLTVEPPLRCARCFCPVPLYQVPPTYQDEYWDLRHWEADYQCCDTLQMHCTVLERAAMKEMSRLDSNLTRAGLEICRKISKATKQSVYYYLYRHDGRSLSSERKRLCPGCGGEWLLAEQWHIFDFKCDSCHLVSNIANTVRSNMLERI